MGSTPPLKRTSIFDPKSLQIDLASEISVIKSDERKKKSSRFNFNINRIEQIPKDDSRHFFYFISSKFNALKDVSLNDELNDGNPIETRKIDINKKKYPKKNKHDKFSKTKISNNYLNIGKMKKHNHHTRIRFSCKGVIKRKFYLIDDEKSDFDKTIGFILHEENFKNKQNLKGHHRHKKQAKSNINKNYKINPYLSPIKSKKSGYCNEFNNKDSLDQIRSILNEIGN